MEIKNEDKCPNCGGKTALCSGYWYIEVDEEPFESGKYEKTDLENTEEYMHGFMCVNCKHVTRFWNGE